MRHSARAFAALTSLTLSVTLVVPALAAPSASIEQARNGPASATVTPDPEWATGNAGASNSHYLESHSLAYRTVMGGLPTDGTVIELIIGYDVKRRGSYAIDYLTHYQRLLPHVLFAHQGPEVFDPLSGVVGVGPEISSAPIPLPTRNLVVDPDGSDPDPPMAQPSSSMASLPAAERAMTLYGGTLLDVSYVTEADPALAVKSSETQVKVRFTASSPTAVLAWGGHLACRWDWGFNDDGTPRSAGGISGSSYHMRLVNWNLGNLGNQDRSMSTDAVYPVPKCGISNLGPFCAGSVNTHVAPDGMESYAWSLFDNTSGASIVGSATGVFVTVDAGTGGSYSLLLTTGASGFTRQCEGTVTVMAPAVADAGPDRTACASSPQVQLAGVASGGITEWSGGAGTFTPSAGDLNAVYTPTAAEVAAGTVTLTLTCSPTDGLCPPASDQMTVTFNPTATVNAGADRTVCASSPQVQLAGLVGGGATSGTWSGGAGTFLPGSSALDATYVPTDAEIAAGGVTLTLTTNDPAGPCDAASDEMRIIIDPAATADAGPDQTVCASSPEVQLAGSVGGGATSGTWSGGSGAFAPGASASSTRYVPTQAEIAAGSVTLTFTTNDPPGPCGPASDQMNVTITPAATVNAGADLIVCASNPQVQLAGSVGGGATSGTWSGGAGSFTPSSSAANATYVPSVAEIAAGGLTLTFTTNDPDGPCTPSSDDVRITIDPAAVANAGPDQTLCAGSPQVQLAGSVAGGATGGTWSGGAGTFTPAPTSLDATYAPTAAEIAAGHVTLTLTTNDPNGPCEPVADQMTVHFDPATVVDAGPDQTVCASSLQVQLHGAVNGTVSQGTWSGGTGSFSPGAGFLNAVYTPSPAEIDAGSVTLVLTSAASSGPCPQGSDAMTIFIAEPATVNAGPDQVVCAVSPLVQLAGSIGQSATGATWSGGAGTFAPNRSALDATYVPTEAEIASGSLTLTLTSNDPEGPCPAVNDQVKIVFDAPAVAVPDRIVCSGITSGTLCADPVRGVAPYTYLWNTGATSRCIAVSDTESYTVTMSDAAGCKATASGAFGHRDCVGQLTHTTTTCATYMDGTGEDFSDVHVTIKDNVITSISPGVFFYYTKITAPASNFTVQLVQSRTSTDFPFLEVQQDQVALYDSDCSRIATGTGTSPGQGSVDVQGATVGQVFIISVKYSLKTLVGTYMDPTMGVHYGFVTKINGIVVDSDPDGLQIGVAPQGTLDVDPAQKGEEPRELLPSPNPFRSGMDMAYAVPSAGGMVSIRVYDVSGRLVRTLANQFESSGRHRTAWDGRDDQGNRMQGGMYFVHVRIGDQARSLRVVMMR